MLLYVPDERGVAVPTETGMLGHVEAPNLWNAEAGKLSWEYPQYSACAHSTPYFTASHLGTDGCNGVVPE